MSNLKRVASSPAVDDLLDDPNSAGPLEEEKAPGAAAGARAEVAAKEIDKDEEFDPDAPLSFETVRNFHILLSDGTYYSIHSNQIPIQAERLQIALADEKRPLLGYWNLKQLIRANIVENADDATIAAVSSEGSGGLGIQ
ncbi:hypothetical protein KEM54_006040 [Ascosphaera aggregata]|nr:hypothetical protein KEM54_006040 [Ascosphaera aggregata]